MCPWGGNFYAECRVLGSNYLNDGVGKPWTGHMKVDERPKKTVGFMDLMSIEVNLGFKRETGSKSDETKLDGVSGQDLKNQGQGKNFEIGSEFKNCTEGQ